MKADIGIIGGTGIYDPTVFKGEDIEIKTPYGNVSVLVGDYEGKKIAILFRHGKDHVVPPHKINHKANIFALKELGVKTIIATGAVGSLQDNLNPGDIVIVDQFIDFGKQVFTYFDDKVEHKSMAYPFDGDLRKKLIESAKTLGIKHHDKGTYIKIEGPQFSTRAASRMYKQFGDVIGMTCVPEAILANELGIKIAVVATVTDYDTFKEQSVSWDEIQKVMKENVEKTRLILDGVIKKL